MMTSRHQNYLGYSYPAELAELIKRESRIRTIEALPKDAHLGRLLEVAYHATLLREEQRPVSFRLLFARPEDLPLDGGPPTGLTPIQLDRPRPFNEQEVRRISMAADFFRSLLAVSTDAEDNLYIWGILVSGTRWVNQVNGGRFIEATPPERFVIQALGPGRLTAFLGQRRLAALSGGRLEGLAFDVFQAQWLREAFRGVRDDADRAISGKLDAFPGVSLAGNFMSIMSQNVVRRTLSVVHNAKHGGTLVFVEPSEEVELACKDGPLRFKYRLAHTPARTRYQTLLARVITRLARLVHEKKLNAVSWDEYQRAPDPELSNLDEALFEFAHSLADLMAVDGALVVTKRLQPVGFGAELRAEAPNLVEVRQALDAEATLWANKPLDEVGTRHRAVYHLCEEYPHCVAIAISQDAAVRFVKNFNGAVTYWDQLSS